MVVMVTVMVVVMVMIEMEVRLRLVNIIGLDQKAEAVHFTNHTVFWPDLLCEFSLVQHKNCVPS